MAPRDDFVTAHEPLFIPVPKFHCDAQMFEEGYAPPLGLPVLLDSLRLSQDLPEALRHPKFPYPSKDVPSTCTIVNLAPVQDSVDFLINKNHANVHEKFKTESGERHNVECNREDLEVVPFAWARNLKDIGGVVAKLAKLRNKRDQWWRSSHALCPLTSFPIKLLPYPPFNMKIPARARNLVDGKALALSMISTCNFLENDWCETEADVAALGEYMHRCKLGSFRPDQAMVLQNKIKSPDVSEVERIQSAQRLNEMVIAARTELEKLQCIQEQRLLGMYRNLTGGLSTFSC
jgi:hypothetical protein|mmetsp:Transcript_81279/g.127983  ORF Transcript_81279/g.127983 Transcript_81279/m.127983 type:complete len:291 (-) Transcript_81279:191-1063(-)|eukprot:CAMPEP_0169100236 /NCGR_PEP_ID=MMETSP1015-20121227/20978_1 /TAXON_ID=342587 /ORGANISM="Karlodinium micrum, Strain CCMP2283" /LENGTH=290 /DNA_ID=CAMNT_0009161161 /DNA_START=59 /DNA_END=931 /DNA_ORIENTATION=+